LAVRKEGIWVLSVEFEGFTKVGPTHGARGKLFVVVVVAPLEEG